MINRRTHVGDDGLSACVRVVEAGGQLEYQVSAAGLCTPSERVQLTAWASTGAAAVKEMRVARTRDPAANFMVQGERSEVDEVEVQESEQRRGLGKRVMRCEGKSGGMRWA
jgi:hypothetical protein